MKNFTFYDFRKNQWKMNKRLPIWSVVCLLLLTMHFGFAVPLENPTKTENERNLSKNTVIAPQAYCEAFGYSSTGFFGGRRYVASFSTTGANINLNYTGTHQENLDASPRGYINATNLQFEIAPGSSFDYSLEANGSSTKAYWIWIDWNNDEIFDTATEQFLGTGYVDSAVTGTINVPAEQQAGTYRMRVATSYLSTTTQPCGNNSTGSYVDFEIIVIPPPSCPTVVGIIATSVDIISLSSVNISWTPTGTESTWNVKWGNVGFDPNTNSGTEIGSEIGIEVTNYSVTNLTPNTTYRIWVQADCGSGDISTWQLFNFYSGYCIPNQSETSDYTSKFSTSSALIDVNYSTDFFTFAYVDLFYNTNQIITQSEDTSFEFIHTYVGGSNTVRIWIDWNKNLQFEDSEEVFLESSSSLTKTGTIDIQGKPLGDYRMRVRSRFSTTVPGACSVESYGSTTDFRLSIVSPPTCPPASLPITATNYSNSSVLLQWVSDGTSFDIEYGSQGFVPGTGTTITEVSNPYTLTGLTAGNNYDYYVRQNCGNGDESLWRGPVSFIPGNYDGKIAARLDPDPQVTSQACGATFNIDVPAGKQITSLKVEYTMTSASPRWVSEQRSVLYSPTLNAGETEVVER